MYAFQYHGALSTSGPSDSSRPRDSRPPKKVLGAVPGEDGRNAAKRLPGAIETASGPESRPGTIWGPMAATPNPLPHLGPVDHIGIAVRDLAAAKHLYGQIFGLALLFEEEIASERVQVAAFDGGGLKLELLASTDPEGPIGRFVERRGEGIHHVCYRVEDVDATLAHLKAAGLRTLDDEPRPGAGGCRVAFIHPKSAGGVLVEISQPPPEGGAHE